MKNQATIDAGSVIATQGCEQTMPVGRIHLWVLGLIICSLLFSQAKAQYKRPLIHESMPPGAIGQLSLLKGRPMAWYYQPVEIIAPQGTKVAFVQQGTFTEDQPAPAKAGCLIGQVYRFRLTEIPLMAGQELYPSVEVIDRLHPPVGKEARFPIPVHITAEEIKLALNGKFVTRVIYLENPKTALPQQQNPDFQPYFEVSPGEDPLQTADRLGRPIAILRIGSRRPNFENPYDPFLYQSPPIVFYEQQANLRPLANPQVQQNQMPLVPQMSRGYQVPVVPNYQFVPPNVAIQPDMRPPSQTPIRR